MKFVPRAAAAPPRGFERAGAHAGSAEKDSENIADWRVTPAL